MVRERLAKFLASAGVASRRKCEEIIRSGRVEVNGDPATVEMNVDPKSDDVKIDGARVRAEKQVYIMLNKPKGCVVTASDDFGRKTVMELVPVRERIVPVGRLDKDTEGLLLMTNDGDFAQKLSHPKFEREKEYEVVLDKPMDEKRLDKLERGLPIDGRPVKLRFVKKAEKKFRVVIHEGRKHIIKRLFERVGFRVRYLRRVRIDKLKLGGLERGQWRYLTKDEVAALNKVYQGVVSHSRFSASRLLVRVLFGLAPIAGVPCVRTGRFVLG